ncbi:hypothetical protein VXQ92_04485 [Acinetobacter sp. 228]|uniref:hypothetical protein n=1 Tax=Acinetobacter sp. 228 TaxID=3114700 RepID=UPI003A85AC83
MDIQKEKEAFINVYVNYKDDSRKIQFNEETEQFMWRKNNVSDTEVEYVHLMNQRWYAWLACAKSKAQAVPDLSELQERIAGHQYYHDEHSHMVVDMDDVVKEISGFDSWKAQAVPEWKDYELEKPNDGQKCLVIFESKDCEDAQRWMCIDEFNEGMFDFIANWEDQCASVALPAGSIISKVRAVCWATTNLSNAPLSFDRFYEAQEPSQ